MIKTLQSFRFVFVMLMVLSHVIGKAFDYGGECAVSYFFILSGFVLSLAYGRKISQDQFCPRRFLIQQFMKFYPLHLLTFLFMVVLDARLGVYYEWYRLLPNILLLQSWIPHDSFYFVANGSSWFLCDVMFFYAVFKPLYLFLNRQSCRRLLLMGAVLVLGYLVLAFSIPLSSVNSILYASPLTRLIDFIIGILLYRVYVSSWGTGLEHWLQRQNIAVLTTIEAALILSVAALFFVGQALTIRLACTSMYWFVMPVFILVFAKTDTLNGLISRLLHHPALLWLGGISFEIFLLHMPVIRVVKSLSASLGITSPILIGAVTALIMVLLSYLAKIYLRGRLRSHKRMKDER